MILDLGRNSRSAQLTWARLALAVFTLALALPGLAGAGAGGLQPGDLLASTGNSSGGDVYLVDPASGSGVPTCSVGAFGSMTEIEFRADGVLFGTTGGGNASLVTIDPESCAETLVGNHPPGAINGLEFIGDVLYGSFFDVGDLKATPEGFSATSLVIVDTTDASLTVIDPLPFDPVRGLAWDPETSTLYGVGRQLQFVGVGDILFTVDPGTGATTTIGPTGFSLGGIEFGPDGVLYGGDTGAPGVGEGGGGARIYAIDTTTGQATPIGAGTGANAISGLAFVPEGGGPSVLEIPALDGLGLGALALLLAALAIFALRARAAR